LRKADVAAEPRAEIKAPAPIALPDWALNAAAPPKPPRRVLSPSLLDEESAHRFAGRGDRDKALRRGTLLHRLMQSLPDIAPEHRVAVAQTFLARDDDLSKTEHEAMIAQVLALLDDSRFAALFAPGSRAELSIAGIVSDVPVAGQIDRLAVTADEVLIADYKTNRPPPTRIEDAPVAYVRQLGLYRALLQKIYPAKTVRAALLWTETPELMELSATIMDAAVVQVTSA
jgi:ATP-dependent helicase/nuclease subunit A